MTGAWLPTPGPDRIGPSAPRADHRPSSDSADVLHVDCDRCAVRGPACSECVISVLLGVPDPVAPPTDRGRAGGAPVDVGVDRVELTVGEQSALAALAGSGLVPPLRLVTAVPSPPGTGLPDGPDDGWDDEWGDGWGDRWDGDGESDA